MSVNISISNTKQSDCQHILDKFIKHGIDSRIIETKSTINGKVEKGCLITLGPPHNDKKKIKEVWNIIKKDYNCAHLNFEGVFNGCIHNYTMNDYCSKPLFK